MTLLEYEFSVIIHIPATTTYKKIYVLIIINRITKRSLILHQKLIF